MKVLVSAATKYGATSEIAQAVADVPAAKGLEVSVVPPGQVGAIEEFDAVILGSAVYMGQWMKPARELAERQAAALAARPVWLFSSGPAGEPAKPADNPVDVSKILAATEARDHRTFTSKLVKKHVSFPDRAMASAIGAAEGDFRNWAEIREWAAGIADTPACLKTAGSGSAPFRLVRSRIVLLAAAGTANRVIAERLGICEDTARKWRRRYCEQGIEGLADAPRSGRPRVFSARVVAGVKALACEMPAASGTPLAR